MVAIAPYEQKRYFTWFSQCLFVVATGILMSRFLIMPGCKKSPVPSEFLIYFSRSLKIFTKKIMKVNGYSYMILMKFRNYS